VSHVAIGDITAVNPSEMLSNTIFGWVGTFFYCYLFADITSLVKNIQSKTVKDFIIKRDKFLNQLQIHNITQSV
jgi:hypothetical protein